MTTARRECFVSMLTSESYLPGAEALLHSLRQTRTLREIVMMVTPDVSERVRSKLLKFCDRVVEVEPISSPVGEARAAGDGLPCWANSGYTKLRLWQLVEYDTVVYVDTDALVLESIDELFALDCDFAAAPDIFPPDKFNAGVLVARPDAAVFAEMLRRVPEIVSHDGGDTGFLNCIFEDWFSGSSRVARLPFRYNAQRTMHWMTSEKAPGYWNVCKPIKILHFSSSPKPWEDPKRKGELELIWWQHYIQTQLSF